MNTEENINVPTMIDEPAHMLIWQWDETLPICIGLIFGIWLDSPVLGMLGGYLATSKYKKIRDDKPRGFYFHMLREYGLYPAKKGFHSMQNALVNKFIS
ncbi:type IV conjugative transfer system protein TraL [Psychromonas aquimarina]|uniref:type IV conjugative transfer system protein TraL n=1 Tax=Psychromonas aquimarina TaxID=444919 RepID=UPI00048A8FA8|nr:type IV conjugative transfer system protein TraL [Psychromonas aquimarina]